MSQDNFFDYYEEWQDQLLRYPVEGFDDEAQRLISLTYYLSGFVSEAGECMGELVKAMGAQKSPQEAVDALVKGELGDALFFYIATLRCLDVSLEDVARNNIQKLNERNNRTL